MSRSAAAVQVSSLSIVKAHKVILQELNFSIPAGRITGLLGPSGSGKTTLMRTIVGVQRITSGSVTVLGRPAGDPALRHELGYVTQSPSVYPDLSVEANVRYFGAMHGRHRRDAAAAIAAVGLEGHARIKTADLSGGELSRASLACALVARPKLLILDEPTVGLDPVLRADLWERFGAMSASGTSLLISSHVMEEASHCASLLLLRQGRLMASLTPDELSNRGGSEDLELAFLNIIRKAEADDGHPNGPGTKPRPEANSLPAAGMKVTE
ncbi:ABC transporter ATP-binding protein [Arthrobacter sp. AL08]|uniref:ABC transporter ATP-binding protein n=1 Tax=unclassified Arthrobacter TaxID=235627 RepID=UPI00249AF10E|nr:MULTISPECIES: ABC transporter ATP-binding protein [unclassified Arthrobacter]MDI3243310.1 ABC transporter ATP-binding protein [Arthrobacter sp. AL05]MDI3279319.1 ABC transporter ATP-binding protein [Arthrobacter sp. AL08]